MKSAAPGERVRVAGYVHGTVLDWADPRAASVDRSHIEADQVPVAWDDGRVTCPYEMVLIPAESEGETP